MGYELSNSPQSMEILRQVNNACNSRSFDRTNVPIDSIRCPYMQNELWYPIPGYPGYELSTSGVIRSFKRQNVYPHGHVVRENFGYYFLTDTLNFRRRVPLTDVVELASTLSDEELVEMGYPVTTGAEFKREAMNPYTGASVVVRRSRLGPYYRPGITNKRFEDMRKRRKDFQQPFLLLTKEEVDEYFRKHSVSWRKRKPDFGIRAGHEDAHYKKRGRPPGHRKNRNTINQ